MATAIAKVVTVAGNRCGHDPAARAGSNPAPARRPTQDPPATPGTGPGLLRRPQGPAQPNAANGSPRQQRSERREACLDLLGALVHYLTWPPCEWGYPRPTAPSGAIAGVSGRKAGLGRRRAERACRDLRRAGLVNIHPAPKRPRTATIGVCRPFGVPEALFQVFGLSKWLQHERDKAVKRHRRHRRRQDATATAADQGRCALNREAARQRAETATLVAPAEAAMDTARRDTAHAALARYWPAARATARLKRASPP